jgi:hypothetical protein
MFKYLQCTPTANLYDLCCDYIETANTLEGLPKANEKIYNLCADYINGGITEKGRIFLNQHFGLL